MNFLKEHKFCAMPSMKWHDQCTEECTGVQCIIKGVNVYIETMNEWWQLMAESDVQMTTTFTQR